MYEVKTEEQRRIAAHAEVIRAAMAKVVLQIALYYGPSNGVYMSAHSGAEGCVLAIKDLYETLGTTFETPEKGKEVAGAFAQNVMMGLAEVFGDTLNVSIARREK